LSRGKTKKKKISHLGGRGRPNKKTVAMGSKKGRRAGGKDYGGEVESPFPSERCGEYRASFPCFQQKKGKENTNAKEKS